MSNIENLYLEREEMAMLATPVMKIVAGYEQSLPNTWRRIKAYREYHDADWDNGIYAPYEHLVQEDSIHPSRKDLAQFLYLNSLSEEGREKLFTDTVRNLKALAGWVVAPNAYVLTPEMTAILSRTVNTMSLPSNLLLGIPEWSTLIAGVFDVQKMEFGRILIDMDMGKTSRERTLRILMVTEAPIAALPSLPIRTGLSIGGAITQALDLPYEVVGTDLSDQERRLEELNNSEEFVEQSLIDRMTLARSVRNYINWILYVISMTTSKEQEEWHNAQGSRLQDSVWILGMDDSIGLVEKLSMDEQFLTKALPRWEAGESEPENLVKWAA